MDGHRNKYGKYACACCGFFTIGEMHDSCPVCSWEEDFYQVINPWDSGGPNTVCLIEAKDNFIKFGVSNPEEAELVRNPLPEEITGD